MSRVCRDCCWFAEAYEGAEYGDCAVKFPPWFEEVVMEVRGGGRAHVVYDNSVRAGQWCSMWMERDD